MVAASRTRPPATSRCRKSWSGRSTSRGTGRCVQRARMAARKGARKACREAGGRCAGEAGGHPASRRGSPHHALQHLLHHSLLNVRLLRLGQSQQLAAQAGGELVQVHPQIVQGVGEAMRVQTSGLGGAFAWPALLRKLDRVDTSYRH